MDGDAVLAYSSNQEFPSGEVFLDICENLYNAFATCQRDIVANTSCPCRACANVANLDLKIMAHHGSFEEMQFGPVTDISGSDVILVHRMAKTDVQAETGIRSYALFSDAAVKAMDVATSVPPGRNSAMSANASSSRRRTASGHSAAILTFPSLSSGKR
jgi:hypothetical protein